MENLNFIPILVATLIPTILGMIYYNPKVLGNAWMQTIGKTEEELQAGMNIPVMSVIGLVLGFLLSFFLNAVVELTHKDVNAAGELIYASDHTFGHGALHGALFALVFFGVPFIMHGLYEQKGWKNILIHLGYWVLTFAVMSGVLDAWN